MTFLQHIPPNFSGQSAPRLAEDETSAIVRAMWRVFGSAIPSCASRDDARHGWNAKARSAESNTK
jgi:hypothetical protein